MNIKAWGKTNPGQVRPSNQDAFFVDLLTDEEMAICVVCDGMGGAKAGDVASECAATSFVEGVKSRAKPQMSKKYLIAAASEAASEANDKVYRKSQSDLAYNGMGTTLVSAIVQNNLAVIINVGDSRAYLVSGGTIERLTRDHSLVEDMYIMGDLTREQAQTHPRKNLITRALGTDQSVKCDTYEQQVRSGDYILLCSDGLSNMVDEQEILFEITNGEHGDSICDRLIARANERGGTDNITVVLMEIL